MISLFPSTEVNYNIDSTNSISEYYHSFEELSSYFNSTYMQELLKNNLHINDILYYSELPKNWDSYDADKVSLLSFNNSVKYIRKLTSLGIPVYFSAPTPEGNILIELRNKHKSIEIEFFSNGKTIYSAYENDYLFESNILNLEDENFILTSWLNN